MTDITPGDNTASDSDEPASLTVVKDDGVEIVSPDFVTTYSIVVTNTGPTALTNIALVDTMPIAGMTFVSASGGGTYNSGTNQITWPLFDLEAGASTSFTVQLRVADRASLGSTASFLNIVNAHDDGAHTGGTPVSASDDDTDLIDATLVKSLSGHSLADTANPQAAIGEILTYDVTFNVPPGTMGGLTMTDSLDAGLAFVECSEITASATTWLAWRDPAGPAPASNDFSPICTSASVSTVGDPANPINLGRQVVFNFHDVINTDTAAHSMTVRYQVVVLDVIENQNGQHSEQQGPVGLGRRRTRHRISHAAAIGGAAADTGKDRQRQFSVAGNGDHLHLASGL